MAFLFAYSSRERTPAARRLEDDVPSHEKKRRLQELIDAFRAGRELRSRERVGSADADGRRGGVLTSNREREGPPMHTTFDELVGRDHADQARFSFLPRTLRGLIQLRVKGVGVTGHSDQVATPMVAQEHGLTEICRKGASAPRAHSSSAAHAQNGTSSCHLFIASLIRASAAFSALLFW